MGRDNLANDFGAGTSRKKNMGLVPTGGNTPSPPIKNRWYCDLEKYNNIIEWERNIKGEIRRKDSDDGLPGGGWGEGKVMQSTFHKKVVEEHPKEQSKQVTLEGEFLNQAGIDSRDLKEEGQNKSGNWGSRTGKIISRKFP